MTTKRKTNKIAENKGIRFVHEVIESQNCIFQKIDRDNDQGNDCYIEFITNEVAKSFCVFVQIKSGQSYSDKSGYKIPSDQNHLAYWNNHTNPVVGIVYDQIKQEAYWVNISEYLTVKSHVLEQKNHTIRVPSENSFSDFQSFKDHFTEYIKAYKSFENYGRSLDNFAQLDDPSICYDGFKSLYSNHRNKSSVWFYIISNFGKIREKGIHGNILGVMSNYIPSDYIFWSPKKMEFLCNDEVREILAKYLSDFFKITEVSIALEFMREGVTRGSLSFRIYKVLSLIKNIHLILLEIAYSESDPHRRDFDFWLCIHFSQWKSKDYTLEKIDEYFKKFPAADADGVIAGLKLSILQNDYLSIG